MLQIYPPLRTDSVNTFLTPSLIQVMITEIILYSIYYQGGARGQVLLPPHRHCGAQAHSGHSFVFLLQL